MFLANWQSAKPPRPGASSPGAPAALLAGITGSCSFHDSLLLSSQDPLPTGLLLYFLHPVPGSNATPKLHISPDYGFCACS
jgi:hypothetical protein